MTTQLPLPLNNTPRPNAPATLKANAAEWSEAARGAYAENTMRAWRSDARLFAHFCHEAGSAPMPTEPATVAAFVKWASVEAGYAPATIRRAVASISRAHKAAGADNPCTHERVHLALRSMHRTRGRAQRQAQPLTYARLVTILEAFEHDRDLRALRDRALLRLAYDLAARRSELVALDTSDIERSTQGHGLALIRRSKADQEGAGAVMFMRPETIQALDAYCSAADIRDGALFRRVAKGGASMGGRLNAASVPRIIKARAQQAGIAPGVVAELSGHSARIGAVHDAGAAGLALPEIQRLGRWSSPVMPGAYLRGYEAERGAMAKLSALQGE